ncbi:4148_t:CDS:1, partial [Ambispora leptoticha]
MVYVPKNDPMLEFLKANYPETHNLIQKAAQKIEKQESTIK